MILEELLIITSEYSKVAVVDYKTDTIIGFYDGKNSIDKRLNNWTVLSQKVRNNILYIEVKGE